jgi:hypothetical protein
VSYATFTHLRVIINAPTADLHGMLPLVVAARAGAAELVRWLLQLGASVNEKTSRSQPTAP